MYIVFRLISSAAGVSHRNNPDDEFYNDDLIGQIRLAIENKILNQIFS